MFVFPKEGQSTPTLESVHYLLIEWRRQKKSSSSSSIPYHFKLTIASLFNTYACGKIQKTLGITATQWRCFLSLYQAAQELPYNPYQNLALDPVTHTLQSLSSALNNPLHESTTQSPEPTLQHEQPSPTFIKIPFPSLTDCAHEATPSLSRVTPSTSVASTCLDNASSAVTIELHAKNNLVFRAHLSCQHALLFFQTLIEKN
jgi:hypothetical protein